MSPKKLSDSDRQKVLNLYRTTDETTSTLANRFGVSSSTISRFLKSNLSTSEYENLIQEKRLARNNPNYRSESQQKEKLEPKQKETQKEKLSSSITESQKQDNQDSSGETQIEASTNINLNSSSTSQSMEAEKEEEEQKNSELDLEDQAQTLINAQIKEEEDLSTSAPRLTDQEQLYLAESEDLALESVAAIEAMFGEDVEDEDDWDEDEDEDEDENEEIIAEKIVPSIPQDIQVLPLAQAIFPRKCYLVVDRASELVTRPLKDFRDLGKIPQEETQQRTLPIFDNHRVAKRFCDQRGKVIKLPNGGIVKKTSSYLQAKGITRLLINGQIYSLL